MSIQMQKADFTAASTSIPPPQTHKNIWHLFFGDLLTATITVATLALLIYAIPRLLDWAVIRSVWDIGTDGACNQGGACWAFLRQKYRLILFGIYPPDEHWRPMATIAIILGLMLWSLPPRNWGRSLLVLWVVGVAMTLILMRGGVYGLTEIPTASWGGLPVTLLLAVFSLGLGFPLALLLALGRRAKMPIPRMLSIGVIEGIRGLPVVSLLFVASILLPIALPEGVTVDKLVRALVALTLFSAAYLAEVIRGGLQAIPKGQYEASQALGLSWLQMTRLVILPQAIQKVIPPLTNTAIVMVKNTSLVLVVGLFDLLSAGRAAMADPKWPMPYPETYLFIAAIYFVICFGISRYSMWLESRRARER